MSSLPDKTKTSEKSVVEFFDNYTNKKLSFPSNDFDAVVNYFEKRKFDKSAAISVAQVVLQQAKIDQVPVFQLLDTLKGIDDVQLSMVVAEILNYNRPKTSTLGFRRNNRENSLESRHIVV